MEKTSKLLYEKIMHNIAKEVKKALYENDSLITKPIYIDMNMFDQLDSEHINNYLKMVVIQLLSLCPQGLYLSKILKVSNDLQSIYNEALTEICDEYGFSSIDDLLNNPNVPQKYFKQYLNIYNFLHIRVYMPELFEQLLNHIDLKESLEKQLPNYFFRKKSSTNIYHLHTIDEAEDLYNLYVSTKKYGSLQILQLVDLTELDITDQQYYELLLRIYFNIAKRQGKNNMYITDKRELLQTCLKFNDVYPDLWKQIIYDMETNKDKSLFGELYKQLSYKNGWLNREISLKYNDIFGNLGKENNISFSKQLKMYKDFPVINKKNDVYKLDVNSMFPTFNIAWPSQYDGYNILFNVDIRYVLPRELCKKLNIYDELLIPVRIFRKYNPDYEDYNTSKWEWVIQIPTQGYYDHLLDSYSNDNLYTQVLDTLKKRQFIWVKNYLIDSQVNEAIMEEDYITNDNYKYPEFGDNTTTQKVAESNNDLVRIFVSNFGY